IKLGDILAETGKYDEALVLFTLLSDLYPENATIQHRIARVYEALHRHAEAMQSLKKEVELREKDALTTPSGKSWYLLGNARAHLHLWDTAVSAYRKSYEIQPLPDTRFCLGHSLILSGDVDEGKAEIFKAVDENGKDLQFLLKIGDALTDLGFYDDAITVYTKALEVRNVRADTWAAIAYALMKLGKKDEARAFFEMAKASAAIREMPWADKLHKSEKTECLDKELEN
ncbi:MAG TPA: tetratricopeptide repeat protein, partial [Methanocorpusculum sp.]|nr:tetratricopeptide repeat protein [Methanocorpusculum sp.]